MAETERDVGYVFSPVISKIMLTRLEHIYIEILNLFGILSTKIHIDQSKLLVFY